MHVSGPLHPPGHASALTDAGTPLVGRAGELAALERILDDPERPVSVVFLSGEAGVGRSRLAAELAARAERRGWQIAQGRAYPVERGVPYALLSDAFLPLMRSLGPETLSVLSRGGDAELRYIFPSLASGRDGPAPSSASDPEEFRTRLLWNFAEFVKACAARAPLLAILEDIHWADPSSLELIHFLARQGAGHPLVLICTYNDAERSRNAVVVQVERSLQAQGIARTQPLAPLTRPQVAELVCRSFGVEADAVAEFAALLFGWTRGNPFFVLEILKSLVASGKLSAHKGTWVGWNERDFDLPETVRDAVITSLASYSASARTTAELVAVIGARAPYKLLASISALGDETLLAALEELCAHRLLVERSEGGQVVYDFRHPVVRDTLYQEFGLQRARLLHGAVAEAMEAHWGGEAMQHADELAYHFARSAGGRLDTKAVTYLAEAGRRAMARHADREAADYLRAALDRLETGGLPTTRVPLLRDLARTLQRMGAYREASSTWEAVVALAPGRGEEAEAHRFLGLTCFWSGRREESFGHLGRGLKAAVVSGDVKERVLGLLARSQCHQELGLGAAASEDARAALADASASGDSALEARAHRTLALLHVWIGPPGEARDHARRAIELASAGDDPTVTFWAHWGLAVLSGMTGDTSAMADQIREAREISEALRSPVLKLWTSELSIEYAYATGEWNAGVALGEQSIALARSLNQQALLPRLLVWTSLFYVGRGDLERSRSLVDEACRISGMHHDGPHDVHLVVPAYIGLAHHLVGTEDYRGAIEAARKGLAIADGTGYTLWAVHRLLPILAEACLWAGALDQAEEVGDRMRTHSRALDHKLGLAWADACDALLRWKRGDAAGGAAAMLEAAEALERIPMIPYAVRIRRQMAGRLAEIGDTDGSLRELTRVHETFLALGAWRELEKARIQFRELGHRPPPRPGTGVAGMTPREVEVARLVGRRQSNKAIGKELGISSRTVSTHLSRIFRKMDVSTRAQLGDVVREQGLLDD